jgi:imidazolonepropionase
VTETESILLAAKAHHLKLKLHADQFHAIGGTELAVNMNALSADHLEASWSVQIQALANSSTVATILPGVTLHLGLPAAPGRALIEAGAAVAIGTDLNPGSSPIFSTQMALALAVRLNRLYPAEALTACTVNAAAALGLNDVGTLEVGKCANFCVLEDWREVAYVLGHNPIEKVFIKGAHV